VEARPWGLHRELINGGVYLQFFMDPPSTTSHSGEPAPRTNAAPVPVPAVTGIAAVTPVTGSKNAEPPSTTATSTAAATTDTPVATTVAATPVENTAAPPGGSATRSVEKATAPITTAPVPAPVPAAESAAKPAFIWTDPLEERRVRDDVTDNEGDIQTLAYFKNFLHTLLQEGKMIEAGGLMTRVPRQDDAVQLSILAQGYFDITKSAPCIVEWPIQRGEKGYCDYPEVPLREQRMTHYGEVPELDFIDPGDEKAWKDLQIAERRWVIVDGNNRQSGVKTAIVKGSKLVPVCTRLICLYTVHCLCKILLCRKTFVTLRYVCSMSTRALKLAGDC
jgi:hypothetical protein